MCGLIGVKVGEYLWFLWGIRKGDKFWSQAAREWGGRLEPELQCLRVTLVVTEKAYLCRGPEGKITWCSLSSPWNIQKKKKKLFPTTSRFT